MSMLYLNYYLFFGEVLSYLRFLLFLVVGRVLIPEKLIDKIEFNNNIFSTGLAEVENIAREFSVENINLVKPGIGEATRVLLRRVPWKILVHSLNDENRLGHIYQLAKEKEVEVVEYPLQNYLACGIIRTIADN